MSDLLDLLFSQDNKPALDEVSRTFGLDDGQTRAAVEELIPALRRGLQQNAGARSDTATTAGPGMEDLLEALRTGQHDRYVDEPASLGLPETRKDGNDILGHIFGNKETSREVARRASASTGIGASVLKKLLPVLATVVMGTLSKRVLGGGKGGSVTRAESGGLLASLLDSDRDGSIWDDVLGMAARGLLR